MRTKFEQDSCFNDFLMANIAVKADRFGSSHASLVYKKASKPASSKAILYLHGFIDYFFQREMAGFFNELGFNFFALDLRRYGRSLEPDEKYPNIIEAMEDYYEELDKAMAIIRQELNQEVVLLMGHSTGGLLGSLYAADRPKAVDALILNSPFFDFNVPAWKKSLLLPAVKALHHILPRLGVDSITEVYPKSLHKDYYGEWDFNLQWKPIENFPAFFAWLYAILKGHERVHRGLDIQCPVLLMHSDKSYFGAGYSEEAQVSDAVLNIQHMIDNEKNLGPGVQRVSIKNGMHDLSLSRKEVRKEFYNQLKEWIKQQAF